MFVNHYFVIWLAFHNKSTKSTPNNIDLLVFHYFFMSLYGVDYHTRLRNVSHMKMKSNSTHLPKKRVKKKHF